MRCIFIAWLGAGLLSWMTGAMVYEGYFCAWPDQTRYRLTCPGSLIRVLAVAALQTTDLNCYRDLSTRPCNQRVPIPPNHIFSIQAMTRCHQRTTCELVGTNPLRDVSVACEGNSTLRNMQVVVFECVIPTVGMDPGNSPPTEADAAPAPNYGLPTPAPPVLTTVDGDDREILAHVTARPDSEEKPTRERVKVEAAPVGEAEPNTKVFVISIGLVIFVLLLGLFGLIIFLYKRGILPLTVSLPYVGETTCFSRSCMERLVCCHCEKVQDQQRKVKPTPGVLLRNSKGRRAPATETKANSQYSGQPRSAPWKMLMCLRRKTAPVGERISGAVHTLVEKVHGMGGGERPNTSPCPRTPSRPEIFVIPNEHVPPSLSGSAVTACVGDAETGQANPNLLGVPQAPALHRTRQGGGNSVRSNGTARTGSSYDEDYMSDFDESEFDDDYEEQEAIYADPGLNFIAPRRPKTLTEEMEYAFCKIQTEQHRLPDEELYANCQQIGIQSSGKAVPNPAAGPKPEPASPDYDTTPVETSSSAKDLPPPPPELMAEQDENEEEEEDPRLRDLSPQSSINPDLEGVSQPL